MKELKSSFLRKNSFDEACVCVYGINDLQKNTVEEEVSAHSLSASQKWLEFIVGRNLIDQVINSLTLEERENRPRGGE